MIRARGLSTTSYPRQAERLRTRNPFSRVGLLLLGLVVALAGVLGKVPGPANAAPDGRYFASTGFRVSSDAFWDYFQKRGGLRNFGYPVSRQFSLLGSKVQLFQRQAMQLRPDGSVGLLNLLDKELMPFNRINNATLPPYDELVTKSAPSPGTPGYDLAILDFVKERAPDSWQGQPVKFWTTFNGSVGLTEAFPNGGGEAPALPALALEIWGVPTSQPAYDPNNRNFIYLRFQRGVMQFDTATGLTQGILLADYLKAILSGQGIPADLEKDAKSSPYYKQYDRTAYRGMVRPESLPGSDLTNAFERDDPDSNGSPTGTDNRPAPSQPVGGGTKSDGAASISNDKLAVALQVGGADHGKLTVRTSGGDLRLWSVPAIGISGGKSIDFSKDTSQEGATVRVGTTTDASLGDGRQLEVELGLKSGPGRVALHATLFEGKTFLTYQIGVRGISPDKPATRFKMLDGDGGGWASLASGSTFLAEDADVRRDVFDSNRKEGELQAGKPLVLIDGKNSKAFVVAALDAVDHYTKYAGRYQSEVAGLRLSYESILPAGAQGTDISSPRLFIDVSNTADPMVVLANYRKVIGSLYPAPAIPDWLRYQWTSWHAFGSDVNEDRVRLQIDAIADRFADLGSWNIVIDNGWYRADGRTDADGRKVDTDRFPSGMRALVDYAHQKGIRVVLTLPGPYVDERQKLGNRWGLRRLIEKYPDYVIEIGTDDGGNRTFLYNAASNGFRGWWTDLIRDVLVTYDADGIRFDGFGDAQTLARRQAVRPAMQAAELYRFSAEQVWAAKPNAYIESGWYVPTYANPYVHTVRLQDDGPTFDSVGPRAGLRQHVDYALYQRFAVNQRPHLGDVTSDSLTNGIGLRWLEAALALGAQASLSLDLTKLTDSSLSELRQRLAPLGGFQGKTSFSFGSQAEAFATTVDGLTYLGVINRGAARKTVNVRLADFGLVGQGALVRDVTKGNTFVSADGIEVDALAGTLRLFVIRQDQGVVWSSSSVTADNTSGFLRLTVRGPARTMGFVELATPKPSRVQIDGLTVTSSAYTFDDSTGLLRIQFNQDQAREIRIDFDSVASAAPRWRRR